MTLRQKKMGVTEYGYQRGIIDGDFLADYEAFKAKAATIKKGQYTFKDIVRTWFPEYADMESFIEMKRREAQPFLFGLSVNHPDTFLYTDTLGLDCLTVK